MRERLAAVPLFAGLDEDDLIRICQGVEEVRLADGEILFEEGDPGDRAYIIDSGRLEVLQQAALRQKRVAVRKPGEVIGEMALLEDAPRNATLRAVGDTVLLAIPRARLDELIATSPEASSRIYRAIVSRWKETLDSLQQAQRMASLGRISAELTHNLNNPAAAVRRASLDLREVLDEVARLHLELGGAGLGPEARAEVERLLREVAGRVRLTDIDPLTRSDLESAMEEWMEAVGVEQAWDLAPALVDHGVTLDDLEQIRSRFGPAAGTVARLLAATAEASSLLGDVERGARAISDLVAAMKRRTHLDQAPVQTVDLAEEIDTVITLVKAKAKGVEIKRELDPRLPPVEAYGRDLGDAIMNLIDNAIDAIQSSDRGTGRVVVRARPEGDMVVIEVEDDGPGIPSEHLDHIFEPFYTTKRMGEGSGLGLSSVSSTMVEHGGDIEVVETRPGRTLFRIELPTRIPFRT